MEQNEFLSLNVILIGLLGVLLIVYVIILVQRRIRAKFLHKKARKLEE